MLFKASAPGSLMLLGEYGVMHGKHALVCAVNKRMTVTIEPRSDTRIEIFSDRLGQFFTDLSNFYIEPPFQFILATLKRYRLKLKKGCTITIESEFSDKIGFGSSAAVTVATLTALATWLELSFTEKEFISEARAIVRQVQGLGSGADVAACTLGGIVAYKMHPLLAEKLPAEHPLTAVYAGYKTGTVEAVKRVKTFFAFNPLLFKQICQAIDSCAVQGIRAVRAADWIDLGKMMNIQQGLMESLGVSTPLLSQIVTTLRKQSAVLGAKISGSGFGDCLIGLGAAPKFKFADKNVAVIPVEITQQGVYCEKS
ncbi:MAG: mevalonate kinase [Gammaproteobacteria bacterium]|nr:mevalonate kinase [Gammaproteobacteria bacterium]